jgi:cyclopropane fatty-acyl-phospholipid synthase-like methyltransferase
MEIYSVMLSRRTARALLLLAAGVLLSAHVQMPAVAQDTLRHEAEQGADHYEHGFENPERYAESWNDPGRADWQKPNVVLEAMGLDEGMTVADLGTGTGYFIPHLARAVGTGGRVLAVDIEPAMLDYVMERTQKLELTSVDTVHAAPSDTRLGASSVDRILTVNTWHHIPNRGRYAAHLADRLRDGGSVWVLDFTQEAPMGPPKEHRLDPQVVADELREGGFEAERLDLGLPHQYVVVGRLK